MWPGNKTNKETKNASKAKIYNILWACLIHIKPLAWNTVDINGWMNQNEATGLSGEEEALSDLLSFQVYIASPCFWWAHCSENFCLDS